MNLKSIVILVACVLAFIFLRMKHEKDDWPIKNHRSNIHSAVAFGDSLTRGEGSQVGRAYPDYLSKMFGLRFVNLGKNGDTSASAKERLPAVLALTPDIVIITLGGNDLLRKTSRQKTVANLQFIFRALQKEGAMVAYAAIDPPFVDDDWVAAIKDTCRDEGVIYISAIMQGIWLNSSLMVDRIHPNSKGYKMIAERVYRQLEKTMNPSK